MNRRMHKTALLAVCFLLWGFRVSAASQDVILERKENTVQVTMGALGEEAVSMQMSLEVRVTKGDADTRVSFAFDPGLSGSVRQYRYDRDTGVLSLYISGDPGHKLSGGEYRLGKVVLEAASGAASAEVSVRSDSLSVVNDAYDLQRIGQVNASPALNVTDGEEPEDPGSSGAEDERNPSGSLGGDTGSPAPPGSAVSSAGGDPGPAPAGQTRTRKGVGIRTGGNRTSAEAGTDEETEELTSKRPESDIGGPKDTDTEKEHAEAPSAGRDGQKIGGTGSRDLFLLAVLTAGGIGAGVVIFLMVLEYDRKKRARARRRRRRKGRPKQASAGRDSRAKKRKKTDKGRP